MGVKKKENRIEKIVNDINHRVWVLASVILAFAIWQLISMSPAGAVFASPIQAFKAMIKEAGTGKLWQHIGYSIFRVLTGFSLGLIVAVPIAFLMGWYKIFRSLIEPWIQFLRTIPPIAYIPLVIVAQGVGEPAKVTVIFIASFLVMVIAVYQGVVNVDNTLIKAARVLGANDRDLFFKVVVPASFPFILVGIRLGLSASLTTLIAAELTGAQVGLGTMIQEASMYFRMDVIIMGIVIIGVIGIILEKIVRFLEGRLTGWQETRQA